MATTRKQSTPSTNTTSSQNTRCTRSSCREPQVELAPLLSAANVQMSAPSESHTHSSGSSGGPAHSDASLHPELRSAPPPVPEQPPAASQVLSMPSMQTTFRVQGEYIYILHFSYSLLSFNILGYNHQCPAPIASLQSLVLAPLALLCNLPTPKLFNIIVLPSRCPPKVLAMHIL